MSFVFSPMTREMAEKISTWKYEPPYDFYDMDPSEEGIRELLNGQFFSVADEAGQTVGFFCHGELSRVPGGYAAGIYDDDSKMDIGLGMDPSRTGRGLGSLFLAEGLAHLRHQMGRDQFRLVVASFNRRAIHVYRKNGFQQTAAFLSPVNGIEVEFIGMVT